jgi:putative oxidoreductase
MLFVTEIRSSDRGTTATSDVVLLIARIMLGWIFVRSGFGKIFDVAGFSAGLARNGVPLADVLGPIGAAVEFFGGLALVLGLRIRSSALLMIAFTVVATLISHRFWDVAEAAARRGQLVQFEKNLAIIGGLLAVWAAGAGRLAVDRFWRGK